MMRRTLFVLLSLFIPLLLLAVVWAQDDKPDIVPQPGVPLSQHPTQMLTIDPTVTLQIDGGGDIMQITTAAASDTCSNATPLTVPGGGQTTVNDFKTEDADPSLSCAWGTFDDDFQGFNTAWYRFTASNHGTITINTLGSTYDTVLSVFDATDNTCPTDSELISLVACSDDANGFSSEVEFRAQKGRTYFIQVANRHTGASGNAIFNLSLQEAPLNSEWEQMGSDATAQRSRHAAAIVGSDIYVIGGQTIDFDPFGTNSPSLTNSIDKYNIVTGEWTNLGDMPGVGYSNTTAVFVNKPNGSNCTQGCIYLPGGYTGGTSFEGKHWAYDIAINLWFELPSIGDDLGWPNGEPFAWSSAIPHRDNLGYYLTGGLSSLPAITTTTGILNKVYFYNIANNEWKEETDMNTAKYGHTAAFVGGKYCVIGGIETGGILSPNGQCWDANGGDGWEGIAALSESRYGAASAVGPNGKWYVYGGANGSSEAISTVEVWDPYNQEKGWVTLDATFDLGVTDALPPRIWPRGGFVGNHLWAIGGNNSLTNANPAPISEVERLYICKYCLFLPFVANVVEESGHDNFAEAELISLNTTYSRDFNEILDLYDMYTFNLGSTSAIAVKLRDIPNNSDYNLYVYTNNKGLRGTSDNPNNLNETVNITLLPGQYYIVVERVFPVGLPNTKNYRLTVEK